MRITMTLSEVLANCNDWERFCEKKGLSPWAVKEGGGDVEVNLLEDDLIEFGLLPRIPDNQID